MCRVGGGDLPFGLEELRELSEGQNLQWKVVKGAMGKNVRT